MAAIYSKDVQSGRWLTSVGPFCDCTHPDRWHREACLVEGCGCTQFLQDGSSKLRMSLNHVHRARLVQTGDGLASHFMSAAKIAAHVRGESPAWRTVRRYYELHYELHGEIINNALRFPEATDVGVPRY